MHDRLIPGTRAANIDHLFIVSSGVWVVDAKTYEGTIERRKRGPWWRGESDLYVGRRNRTNLADQMNLQIVAVKAALKQDDQLDSVLVYPALCFVDTKWPRFLAPFDVRGVNVVSPRALRRYLEQRGPLSQETLERAAHVLAKALPAAHRD